MTSDHDLERLRELVLGTNKELLEKVHDRLTNPASRAEDIAEVLADASTRANLKDSNALALALEEPISAAINSSIEHNPQRLADVLFPVMMPAIRRAIAETMRQFIERIDILVNQQFSMQALKWRFEALRSGVPFQEILLRETLLFNVEQVLLIENGSGLLMQHLHSDKAKSADSDAVSGMLWAIESFVRDSFTNDPEEGLNRVTMGDHIVYLGHGPHATLACVIRGVATTEFLNRMDSVVERLHSQHRKLLTPYSGNKEELEPTQPLLSECLQTEYKRPVKDRSSTSRKFIKFFLLSLLIAGVGFIVFKYLANSTERSHVENLVQDLNNEPGIIIVSHKKTEDRWLLRGLRDPLSRAPERSINPRHLDAGNITFDLAPYLSLEPEVQTERVRQALNLPQSVNVDVQNGGVALSGSAPVTVLLTLHNNTRLPTGVSSIDPSNVKLLESDVRSYLFRELQLPEDAQILIENRTITFPNKLPAHLETAISRVQSSLTPIATIETDGFAEPPSAALEQIVESLNQEFFLFSDYATLTPESIDHVSEIADVIIDALKLSESINKTLKLILVGHSSPEGDELVNLEIRIERGKSVKRVLIDEGVPSGIIKISESRYTEEEIQALTTSARRADLEVSVIDHNN